MTINTKTINTAFEALCWVLMLELPFFFGNSGSILLDTFVVLLYFIGHNQRYNLRNCKILFLPILGSLIIGLFRDFSIYDVFKDVFYLSTPIIAIMIGEIWARNHKKEDLLDFVVLLGVIFSIINIFRLYTQFGIDVFFTPRLYRDEDVNYTAVNNLAILSLAIYLYYLIYKKIPRYRVIRVAILLVAVYLSGSRSLYLVVFFYLLTLLYPLFQQNITRFIAILGLLSIIVALVISSAPDSHMVEMFRNSTAEMKIRDYSTMSDVNTNYRGYEAFCAMAEYKDFSVFNKFFGGGCGQLVDLGALSPFEFSKIPVLHNGYPYFLIKMGIAGLLIFVLFFIKLGIQFIKKLKKLESLDDTSRLFYLMGLAGTAAMLFTHASVNAIFNFDYVAPLYMISALSYYQETNQL